MFIGIDLGTTNSSVAVMSDTGPTTLANELGEHLTPSVVAIAEDGTTLVGRAAKDRLVAAPDAGRAFFKRDMGTDIRYRFGGDMWTPPQCSAFVLREMKRIAEMRTGQDVTGAVITVPAYFHDPQRQATLTAAKIAGIPVERILNEPTAAALAHGYERPARECHLLVFDLGGGTFDVTLLEAFEGVIEVKASAGDAQLGGEDYTDALLDWWCKRVARDPDPKERARLRQKFEVIKRRLSTRESVEVVDGQLTHEEFVGATAELTARLRPIVQRCLRDADLRPDDLDDVLLVGGASRMRIVHDFIKREIGRDSSDELDPDRAVAFGAAVQAAACAKDEAVQDLVLTDVCPHTLGISISKEFGGRHEDGFFQPILDRNITVPTSRSDVFTTLHPDQDVVNVTVYQGESRRVEHNTKLGQFSVKGLKRKRGEKEPGMHEVRFTYDMNGILEIEVTVLSTGRKFTKVIESRPGAMSKREIDAAVRRLQPLKIRPRDLLPNRARLERANRLFAELKGDQRRYLDGLVDAFEAALVSQDSEAIGFARAALDQLLVQYYVEEGENQTGFEE